MASIELRRLNAADAAMHLDALVALLEDVVAAGASVGFLHPMAAGEAAAYWRGVLHKIEQPNHHLYCAFQQAALVGTAQLFLENRPNGAHRAEVSKVLVQTGARRQGIGAALMQRLEEEARFHGRTLLVLDTRTGDDAERLYRRLGYAVAGIIPGYALRSGGGADGSTFMYKVLGAQ